MIPLGSLHSHYQFERSHDLPSLCSELFEHAPVRTCSCSSSPGLPSRTSLASDVESRKAWKSLGIWYEPCCCTSCENQRMTRVWCESFVPQKLTFAKFALPHHWLALYIASITWYIKQWRYRVSINIQAILMNTQVRQVYLKYSRPLLWYLCCRFVFTPHDVGGDP